MKITDGITKETKKEVLRAIRLLAFGILDELKDTMKRNLKCYNGWNSPEDSSASRLLAIQIKCWKEVLECTPKRAFEIAGAERARQQYYCQYQFGFRSQIKEINDLIVKERKEKIREQGWEGGCRLITISNVIGKFEEYFYNHIGWRASAGFSEDQYAQRYIEEARKMARDYISDFEEWEKKGKKRRKTSKRVKEVKNVANNADASTGISIKSFCCSVMGAIRDYMVKSGIEDYKGATCELGQKRKEAVRSLICYSKTQDSQKVQNFKDQIKGAPYSSRFSNWPELAEAIKSLEVSFIG